MKKRTLALLLAAALCLGLLAGCGNAAASSAESAAAESISEVTEEEAPAAEEAPAEESPVAEEEASAAEEAPAAEEETVAEEEAPVEHEPVTLPITEEETTYTMWATLHPAYMNYVTDLADTTIWKELAERTNISFEFTAVSGITASDSFGLMIAGGDYTDVICEMDLFSEGVEAAIEQDIILDIREGVEEYAPTYWDYICSDDAAYLTLVTDSGAMGLLATIRGETGSTDLNGPMVRLDWLEEFGMEDPTTIEDLYAYLTQANETYGAVTEFSADGADSLLMSIYNLSEYIVEDGEVYSAYTSDRFYNYLETASQWYQEGIIDPNFYTINDTTENASKCANGQYSLFSSSAQGFTRILQHVVDADSSIVLHPIAYVTTEVSPEICVGQDNALITDDDTWAISTACDDPEPLLTLVEYMCSEEGQLLYNYGLEDVNYTLNADGEPEWTEYMTANEEYAFDILEYLEATASLPGIRDFKREMWGYSEQELLAVELYGSMNTSFNYPSYAVMTSDESTEYSAIEADLSTYAESEILAFITGQKEFNDAAWDEFQDTLDSMGIADMIALKQAAYDRAQEKLAALD